MVNLSGLFRGLPSLRAVAGTLIVRLASNAFVRKIMSLVLCRPNRLTISRWLVMRLTCKLLFMAIESSGVVTMLISRTTLLLWLWWIFDALAYCILFRTILGFAFVRGRFRGCIFLRTFSKLWFIHEQKFLWQIPRSEERRVGKECRN